jgi:hypothetical protein
MNFDEVVFKELKDRLLRLENQNHRIKQIGVSALVVFILLTLVGQTPHDRTVEANEFILRDGNGSVRARLDLSRSNSSPEMVLFDEKGRTRIKIEGGGPVFAGTVSVFDSQGEVRGIFSARELGGGISLLNSKGRAATTLFPGDIWVAGGVRLEDDDGFAAWLGKTNLLSEGQAQTGSAASLTLVDNVHRKVLWKAP